MINIVFVSNFFNHHEKFFCDELDKNDDVVFSFIQTEMMNEERIRLGWGIDTSKVHYVMNSYESCDNYKKALQKCENADVLILGSAPYDFVAERVKKNKLTFYYAERLFRQGLWHMLNPKTFLTVLKRFIIPGRKSNFYLLAASGYTAVDTAKIFAFNNHRFKWGHFIEVGENLNNGYKEPLKRQSSVSMLWAGRLIALKHPDMPIRIAKTLKSRNIDFSLNIIGTGVLEQELQKLIHEFGLEDCVHMLGAMSPKEVRKYMQNSDIYMFTSDFNEGWGAVLGESMASGCAVVTSHGIGATPFLITHNQNGLIYETGNYDSFERNVLKLVASKELRMRLSRNAQKTMSDLWNPKVGAERFYQLCCSLLEKGEAIYYDKGPISKAEVLKNNWFKDDTI